MPAARRLLLLMVLLQGACSAPSPSHQTSPRTAAPASTAPAPTPSAATSPTSAASPSPVDIADDPGSLALEPVATGLGAILRLDVSPPDGYAVPADNPFVDGGGAPEIFAYGLRNPWRFSFDAETGLLWIADVGQSALDEIDRIDPGADAGANLGWNLMEGSACFREAACATDGLVLPVAEYGRDAGCSVTGGYVSRGDEPAGLRGWYMFGDYCTGAVFGVRSDTSGETVAPRVLLDSEAAISSFGEDDAGRLYLADLADLASGTIYRIVDGD